MQNPTINKIMKLQITNRLDWYNFKLRLKQSFRNNEKTKFEDKHILSQFSRMFCYMHVYHA